MSTKLWIDALEFSCYGGWKADTQFTHLMGSGYLLACESPGIPVDDAVTQFCVSKEAVYRVWVRTKNWYYPYSPGKFKVKVDDRLCPAELGTLPSHDWLWQIAGDYPLKAGTHTLSLADMTGYFGRCSSILITDDMDYVPPRRTDEFEEERAKLKKLSMEPIDGGNYDIVVVGAGPAGIPASIAAARHGMKCLVISNRPVIGGNASTECNVKFTGASSRQPNAREGGIMEEIMRTAGWFKCSWTEAMLLLCKAEKNLTIVYNQHVIQAQTKQDIIVSVISRDVVTGTRHRYFGKYFIDASGDGWLLHEAKAKYRIGREAYWQHQEPFAPDSADLNTMSGCIMNSLFEDSGHPCEYRAPEWVHVLPPGKEFGRNIEAIKPVWWTEAPNDLDDVYDAELARDELFRVLLSYFHYLKNLWEEKESAANYIFKKMPYIDAKRESRRMVGDYLLTQNDCMSGESFEDVIAYSGWPIDLHHIKGIYSGKEGPFFSNCHVPLVQIPYRCVYSANIQNLFAAGRNISVTHVALGTVRVQSTLAIIAQAVGTAAAMCIEKDLTPRELGKLYITKLQQQLLRDDLWLPGVQRQGDDDLAYGCSVTASSEKPGELWWNHIGIDGELLPMDRQRATFLARGQNTDIPSLYLKLYNHTDHPLPLTIHLREQADPDAYTANEDLLVMTRDVPANGEYWVEYPIHISTELRYLWLYAEPQEGLSWRIQRFPPLDWTRSERLRDTERFINIRRQSHCVSLTKPEELMADCSAQNIVNGYSRIQNHKQYEWVSDPAQGLPQWICVELKGKQYVDEIHLVFDTDMCNPSTSQQIDQVPARLVTDYRLTVLGNSTWQEIARVKQNYLRKRIHRFKKTEISKIRLEITGSGDGKTARVFQISAYCGS